MGFPGSRLRVGLLCGDLEPALDGVADYSRRLAIALSTAGLDPVLLTTYLLAQAADAVGITAGWDLSGMRAAARAIRTMSLDILHVQFAPSVFGFSRAVGLLPLLVPERLPIVVTLHEYGTWSSRTPLGGVTGRLWSAAERLSLLDRETLLLTPRRARVVVTNAQHLAVAIARFPAGDPAGRPGGRGSHRRQHRGGSGRPGSRSLRPAPQARHRARSAGGRLLRVPAPGEGA